MDHFELWDCFILYGKSPFREQTFRSEQHKISTPRRIFPPEEVLPLNFLAGSVKTSNPDPTSCRKKRADPVQWTGSMDNLFLDPFTGNTTVEPRTCLPWWRWECWGRMWHRLDTLLPNGAAAVVWRIEHFSELWTRTFDALVDSTGLFFSFEATVFFRIALELQVNCYTDENRRCHYVSWLCYWKGRPRR